MLEHLFEDENCWKRGILYDKPRRPPSYHYSRVVYIVYTMSICVNISAATGFKKEVYLLSLKRIKVIRKVRHLFGVLLFKTQKNKTLFFVFKVCLMLLKLPSQNIFARVSANTCKKYSHCFFKYWNIGSISLHNQIFFYCKIIRFRSLSFQYTFIYEEKQGRSSSIGA